MENKNIKELGKVEDSSVNKSIIPPGTNTAPSDAEIAAKFMADKAAQDALEEAAIKELGKKRLLSSISVSIKKPSDKVLRAFSRYDPATMDPQPAEFWEYNSDEFGRYGRF